MNTVEKPSVLFVCVHNAGRSQMAAAFLTHLSAGRIEVRSAGSAPADSVNPAAVEAMNELGIDMSAETPKILTTEAVKDSDVVITMGCGIPAQSSPASVMRTGNLMIQPDKASKQSVQSATRSAHASKHSSQNYCPPPKSISRNHDGTRISRSQK